MMRSAEQSHIVERRSASDAQVLEMFGWRRIRAREGAARSRRFVLILSLIGSLSGPAGFVDSFFHLRSVLSRSATFDKLSGDSVNCTNAHSPLSVSRKSILSGKGVPTEARIRLGAGVDLGMSLQVMAAHESLVAVVALELPIIKVGLHVRFDVLFSAEALVAVVELANPLVVHRIWPFYVLRNVIQGNIRLLDRSADAWFEVEVRNRHSPWRQCCSDRGS